MEIKNNNIGVWGFLGGGGGKENFGKFWGDTKIFWEFWEGAKNFGNIFGVQKKCQICLIYIFSLTSNGIIIVIRSISGHFKVSCFKKFFSHGENTNILILYLKGIFEVSYLKKNPTIVTDFAKVSYLTIFFDYSWVLFGMLPPRRYQFIIWRQTHSG